MARLGLSSFSYHLHLEDMDHPRCVAWFLERVVDLGLDGCQVVTRHMEGWNEELVADIGRFCSEHGLYLELASGGFDFARLADRLTLSAAAQARLLRTFISGDATKLAPDARNAYITSAIENFKRLAEVAEKVGVILAIENIDGLAISEYLHILSSVESPYFRMCLDTGNPLRVWEDPVQCVKEALPYMAGVHLKDWKHWWQDGISKVRGCPIGQGDVDIAAIYRIIRTAKPDMPVTLEIPCLRPDGITYSLPEENYNVIESIRYIRDLEVRLPQIIR